MDRQVTFRLLASLLATGLGGCAIYDDYGFDRVARSRLDPGRATPVVLPPGAPTISQRFRPDDAPFDAGHRGFDLLVPAGTPVIAAASGSVSRLLLTPMFGRQIRVDHGSVEAGHRLQTRYVHLSAQLVREGDAVRRGQLLGYSGMSGLAAGFPHLHFEVHRLDDADPPRARGYLDPQLFWVDGIGRVTCFERGRDYTETPVRLTYPVPCRGLDWD